MAKGRNESLKAYARLHKHVQFYGNMGVSEARVGSGRMAVPETSFVRIVSIISNFIRNGSHTASGVAIVQLRLQELNVRTTPLGFKGLLQGLLSGRR